MDNLTLTGSIDTEDILRNQFARLRNDGGVVQHRRVRACIGDVYICILDRTRTLHVRSEADQQCSGSDPRADQQSLDHLK